MSEMIKILNKFNGNLCFSATTEHENIIIEVILSEKNFVQDNCSRFITSICLINNNSYGVVTNNQYIGKFENGFLNETYINTGLSKINKIQSDTKGNYYLLDRELNILYKYNAGVIWSLSLPDYSYRENGKILLRESDKNILYFNNYNFYFVRDDGSSCVILNSNSFDSNEDLKMLISNEFNYSPVFARYRSVSLSDLQQTSSSSTFSSSSSSG